MERKAKGEKRGGESKRETKWKGVGRKGGSGRGGGRVASWLLGGWTTLGQKRKISPFSPPMKNRGGLLKMSVGIIRP